MDHDLDPNAESPRDEAVARRDPTSAAPSRVERSIRYPDDPPDRFGRYVVGEAVGRGGAGTVYLATDTVLGREVALKVCRASVAKDPVARDRFVHDARIASRLDHPGIVPVFDSGELPDGRPYFAMKRVAGESLAHALIAERPHDRSLEQDVLADYLEVFFRIAEAVAHAHDAGVIHGDLKPKNIMLGPAREVFVVDWGFARPDFPSWGGEAIGGTIGYLAPEAILDRPNPDPRSGDVYGLGAILCEILTGAPPIVAATRAEARSRFLEEERVGSLIRFADIDSDLADLASRCVAIDPAARPKDARSVAREVRELLDARRKAWRAAEVHAAAAVERARAARRRLALVAGLVVSITVTVLVLVAVGLARERAKQIERAAVLASFSRAFDQARSVRDRLEVDAARQIVPSREDAGKALDLALEAAAIASGNGFEAPERNRAERLVADLRRQVSRIDRFSALSRRLLELRPHWSEVLDHADCARQFARAFEATGFVPGVEDREFLDESALSGRVDEIVAALDAWIASSRTAKSDASQIAALERATEFLDRDDWRKEVRKASAEPDSTRLVALANAQDVESRSPRAVCTLADRLVERGEGIAARKLLARVVLAQPGDAWLRHDLANLAADLEPIEVELARVQYHACLAIAPESPHVLLDVARFEAMHGSPDDALTLAKKAFRLAPDTARAPMLIAGLLMGAGDLDGAIENLERAADLGFPWALPSLVDACYRGGYVARALRHAETETERTPDSFLAWTQLGRLRITIGDDSAAVVALERATALEPRDARPLLLAGYALARLGRTDEATSTLDRAEQMFVAERDAAFSAVLPAARSIAVRTAELRVLRERGGDPELDRLIRSASPGECEEIGIALLAIDRPDLALRVFEDVANRVEELGPRRFAVIAAIESTRRDPTSRGETTGKAHRWLDEEVAIGRRLVADSDVEVSRRARENLEVLAVQPILRAWRDFVAADPSLGDDERAAWRTTFHDLDSVLADASRPARR